MRRVLRIFTLVSLAGVPSVAAAQGFETFGPRAQGMGGAFVAVSDDATAVWWNPAGLSAIPLFDLVVAWSTAGLDEGAELGPGGVPRPWDAGGAGVSIALPVAALSYVQVSHAVAAEAATAGMPRDREDGRTAVLARRFVGRQFGASVAQSLGDALVVGATVRLLRGRVAAETLPAAGPEEALDTARNLDGGDARFAADLDVGVLANVGRIRLGLTARNLAAPGFGSGETRYRPERLVRAGVAIGGEPGWGRRGWTVALDADLTTADWGAGARRSVAVGGERWWGSRLALRGGLRAQTIGAARPVATAGASVTVRAGVLIEGAVVGGGVQAERGWGLAARVTF